MVSSQSSPFHSMVYMLDFVSLCLSTPLFISLLEYTITMYDTKSRELRWNATYSDYASTLPDDDTKYSKALGHIRSFV